MEKNSGSNTFMFMMVLAVVLIGFLWVSYFTTKDKNISTNTTNFEANQNNVKINNNVTLNTIQDFELVEEAQTEQYDLVYENKNIKIEFSPYDAIIKNAWAKDTFMKRKEVKMYDLVLGDENNGALRLKFGSWENDITISTLTGGKNLFNYKREGDKFIFTCKLKKKSEDLVYTIIKTYQFIDDENLFKLTVDISNSKNIPINFDNSGISFSIAWGPRLGVDKDKPYNNRYDMFTYLKNSELKKVLINDKMVKDSKINFATKTKEGNEYWLSCNNHYFTTIIYPDNQNYKFLFDYRKSSNNTYYGGLSRDTIDKSVLKSEFYVYVGPKLGSVLNKYNNFEKENFSLKETKFSAIDASTFFYIDKLLTYPLNWIFLLVKNYGIAIIIFTILIKLLMSPLTHQSMVSQEKMSKLQPKMKVLQEKYKDKPEVLNRETMNLYKKEGINPLSGCLPLVLQMPILFAMYGLIDNMFQLKGESFLWINDLALPDSVLFFPFTLPFVNINSLNILPIIMTGVSVLSTMFMPDTSSNKQAKIMMWSMPLVFFFLFYNVSSGLVLYWTVMNILNLVQQIYINYFRKKIVKKA